MKPRSIVFDVFGDYVRYDGGEIRLRALIDLVEGFGFSAATVRVAVARMRDEGWFATRRCGRETVYQVTPRLLAMLDEGRERIFTRMAEPWDGRWSMVIYAVPETARSLREHLRRTLSWLGFGPLAPSTWICPHDRLSLAAEAFAGLPEVRLDLLTMSSSGLPADRQLADRCWDLAGLHERYQGFVRQYRPCLAQYRRGALDDGEAFRERIGLVHAYRKFPFDDPDLPVELLPAGWVGSEAHQLFLEAHKLLTEPAESHYQATVREYT